MLKNHLKYFYYIIVIYFLLPKINTLYIDTIRFIIPAFSKDFGILKATVFKKQASF